MNYGLAREQGLDGARRIASSLDDVAKAINRLAAAKEKENACDNGRTASENTDSVAAGDYRPNGGKR